VPQGHCPQRWGLIYNQDEVCDSTINFPEQPLRPFGIFFVLKPAIKEAASGDVCASGVHGRFDLSQKASKNRVYKRMQLSLRLGGQRISSHPANVEDSSDDRERFPHLECTP